MSNNIVTSITLYGEVNDRCDTWERWYKACKNIVMKLGYEPNYLSIESTMLKSGKVMKLKSAEKDLKALKNREGVKWITVYSLPIDFGSASFDYNVLIVRTNDYICLICAKDTYKNIDEEEMLRLLEKHIDCSYGEIYEMDRDECPLIYASRANPASYFSTLKIIKKLTKEYK